MATSAGTPRMKKILIERVTNANAKGKGYKFSSGYNTSWTELARELAEKGKLELRHGRFYMTGAKAVAGLKKAKKVAKTAKVVAKRKYTRKAPVAPEAEILVRKFKRQTKTPVGIPLGKPVNETLVSSVVVPPAMPTKVLTSYATTVSAMMISQPAEKVEAPVTAVEPVAAETTPSEPAHVA